MSPLKSKNGEKTNIRGSYLNSISRRTNCLREFERLEAIEKIECSLHGTLNLLNVLLYTQICANNVKLGLKHERARISAAMSSLIDKRGQARDGMLPPDEASEIRMNSVVTAASRQRIGSSPAAGDRDMTRIAYYPVGHTIADMVQHLVLDTLEHCHGNRTHAARTLGISLRTLRNRLRQYGKAGIPIPAKRR